MARFEIDVLTRFRSVGLSQVAGEARRALEQVATTPGISSAQRVTRANQIRVEAERAISTQAQSGIGAARSSGLTGNALAQAEAQIRTEAGKQRRAVTRLFNSITTSTDDFARRLNRALTTSGSKLLTASQARGAVSLTPLPPTAAEAKAAERLSKARTRADSEAILQNDPAYYAAQQSSARSAADRSRREAQQRAADETYLRNTALAAQAKKEEADRLRAFEHGVGGAFTRPISEVRVASAVSAKVNADLQAAAVARQRAALERNAMSGLAQASAARRSAERELNAAIHANARAEVKAAIASGEGTRFQRLQSRFQAGGSARLPSEFQTLGGFTGSRALTTIGYGVAGTALYGSIRAIGEMLKEAEELDRVLNQIQAQLEATDSAGQFPQARAGILEIARATGAQADEIAAVQFQFQGAFRNAVSGQIDVQEALRQTEAAIKITQITGLSLAEVLDSLTATAKTFKVDIADIGDVALGVQERFGVLARETVTFVADLAPVAEQVGLSLKDTASLAGVAQQVSGRSGSALAEGFGRILPQLQEVRAEILQIYNLPQLKDKQLGIAEAFGSGNTGAVFKQLVEDYGSLNAQQQQFVINLLGGRREAQVLIPILQNSGVLVKEWADNAAGLNDSTGKTNSYFADLRQTVQNTQARMTEAFKQIGQALFEAGLADGLKLAANSAATLADGLGLVFDVLEKLNSIGAPLDALIPGDIKVFDDLPGKLLLLALVMGSVNKAFQFFRTLLTATAAAETAEAAASVANAAANAEQATASGLVVVAKGQEANAVRAAMAADAAEAESSAVNAAANAAQAGASGATGLARLGGLFTAGGAPAATALGVAGVVTAGALVVGNEYLNQRSETQGIEDQYIDQLKTYSNTELRKISEQTTSFWGRVSDRWFGVELPEELAAEQLVRNESAPGRSNIASLLARNEKELIDALKDSNASDVLEEILRINEDRFGDTKLDDILGVTAAQTAKNMGHADIKVGDLTPDQIREILKAAEEDGDVLAAMAVEKINKYLQDNAALRALLGESLASDVEDKAIEEAGGAGAYALQKVDDARKQFEGGQISTGSFLRKLKEARDAAALAARTSDNPEDDAAFFEADQQTREFLAQIKLNRVEQIGNIVDLLSGGSAGTDQQAGVLLDQQIALISQFLASGEGTQEQRFAQIPELIGLLRDKFERELATITDDAERARREAQGFTLPPQLQSLLTEQQLVNSPQISAAIEQYATLTGESLQDSFQQVADTVVATDRTVKQVTIDMIDQAIADLTKLYHSLFDGSSPNQIEHNAEANRITSAIQGLEGLKPTVPDYQQIDITTGYSGSAGDATKRADDARKAARAREEAQLAVARARAEGDPVRLAQLDIQAADIARKYAEDDAEKLNAEADRIRAQNSLQEAQQDIDRARYELYAAQVQRDPVRAARAQVSLAYIAIAQAKGTADRIRAQIQMVNAQAQLVQAQQDVTYAWLEGVQSYFTIIGDSVRAAEIALQLAQTQLRDILADRSSGAAERQRARTAVQEAEANLRNAKFDDQLGDIEYMLELEKISVAQAIQMLQRMAEIPGLTEEQLRTIERRIKALREEVSGNLAFNMPDISLPTLYEVRRLMGSGNPAGTGSYQDNRNITVSLQISENVDAAGVMAQLADLLDAPSITGVYPRNY